MQAAPRFSAPVRPPLRGSPPKRMPPPRAARSRRSPACLQSSPNPGAQIGPACASVFCTEGRPACRAQACLAACAGVVQLRHMRPPSLVQRSSTALPAWGLRSPADAHPALTPPVPAPLPPIPPPLLPCSKVDAEALQAIKSQRAKARAEGHAAGSLSAASSLPGPAPGGGAGRATPPAAPLACAADPGADLSPFASGASQGLARTPSSSNLPASLGQATSLPVAMHSSQRSQQPSTTPPASAAGAQRFPACALL